VPAAWAVPLVADNTTVATAVAVAASSASRHLIFANSFAVRTCDCRGRIAAVRTLFVLAIAAGVQRWSARQRSALATTITPIPA
jgi:hypothetical protein